MAGCLVGHNLQEQEANPPQSLLVPVVASVSGDPDQGSESREQSLKPDLPYVSCGISEGLACL